MVSDAYGKAWTEANRNVYEAKSLIGYLLQDEQVKLRHVESLRMLEALVDGIFGNAMLARADLEAAAEKYHTLIEELEETRDE